MRVMVIGAAGMLGHRLVHELVEAGLGGQAVETVIGVDLDEPSTSCHETIVGDIADPDFVDLVASRVPDVIFHLSAVVSSQAEAQLELGYDVNVHGTWHLLEAMRVTVDWTPRVVFASSIAVFGGTFPAVIGNDHRVAPRSSYGTQKAIGELLISDYTRRGALDGIAVRLPTVVVRPGAANRAASGFLSSIVREPLAGGSATVPVPRDLGHWIASPSTAVAQLMHAAVLSAATLGDERILTMPGLTVSVDEIIAAVVAVAGPDVLGRITDQPDPTVARIVASWPASFDATRALALGFPVDTSIDDIVAHHVREAAEQPGRGICEADDDDDVTGMAFTRLVDESATHQPGAVQPMIEPDDAASAVLAKVRTFIDTLDADERQIFAAMLAPAVAEAWDGESEVEGFGAVWTPTSMKDHLNQAIREQRFRIERSDEA